jgi:hypothetical protein
VDYYSAIMNIGIKSFSGKWMDLKIIMVSEVSWAQKNRYHVFSYVESKN